MSDASNTSVTPPDRGGTLFRAGGGFRAAGGIRRVREGAIMGFMIACGLFTLATTVAIVVILAREAYNFFTLPGVTFVGFITGLQWNPLLGAERHFGIWPLVAGTFLITAVAMVVAMPLGLITAIWLSEYAHPRLRAVLKPVLEILAGVPTVVLGFFALTTITPALQWSGANLFSPITQMFGGGSVNFSVYNAASAGIAVGILCLPIVTSLTEDALRAVPQSLREASYGVGATRLETSLRVIVPAGLSGIVAAFLLAIARAVGETMVVALAAGSVPLPLYNQPSAALDVTREVQPMTGYIVQIFLGDASNFGPEYLSSYAVAGTLFLITFVLTLIGNRVRVRFQQQYE